MLHQRRALCSGDTAKTLKDLFSGDRFSSLGLSDRFQKLRLKLWRNFKGFVGVAREDRDHGAFRQWIAFHDNLAVYDCSGG